MKANLMNGTIEMTRNEAKAAGKIKSDKFNELKQYQTEYPTFIIRIVETRKKKSEFSGLTYKYMETYIQKSDKSNKDDLMQEFYDLTGASNKGKKKCEKAEVASYLDVKDWFLKKFPEINEYKTVQSQKIKDILAA